MEQHVSEIELSKRKSELISTVEARLPEFARACRAAADLVVLHQDSFAADYQESEYRLLGMAVKYAGLLGKQVQIIGQNRQTLKTPQEVQ